jgi:hypothetical protein
MAQVKLTWVERQVKSKIVNIPFDINYLNDCNISDAADLKDYIMDYYNWNNDDDFLFNYLNDEEQEHYYGDLEAELLDDSLIDGYKYLIKPTLNCCDGQIGNYCPHCGKKLK